MCIAIHGSNIYTDKSRSIEKWLLRSCKVFLSFFYIHKLLITISVNCLFVLKITFHDSDVCIAI